MPIVDGEIVDWRHKIDLKRHVLDQDKHDFTPEEMAAKTEKFWKIVKSKSFMQEFVEEWESMYPADTVEDVQTFDELLSEFYDFCDYNLIWVK